MIKPIRSVDPDPRTFRYIPAKDLEIDPAEQRDVTASREHRIAEIAANWSWMKCEALTVRETPGGSLKVIEGQGRVLAMMQIDPDTLLPCFLVPVSSEEAAEVAAGIAKSRTPHGRYDHWKLRVRQHGEHELAVETMLAARQLQLASATTPYSIASIKEVETIISRYTPDAGAQVLSEVIDILRSAYPDKNLDNNRDRWNAPMLRIVYRILVEYDDVQPERLARILASRPAAQWMNIAKQAAVKDKDGTVISVIVSAYDKKLRAGRLRKAEG